MVKMIDDSWRNTLQECIVYDMLFKALMADKEKISETDLKLRYGPTFEKLSLIAEKQHHYFRRELDKMGCRVVSKENRNGQYIVLCRVKGYVQETVFSGELLRAECEVRLLNLIG